MELVAGYQVLDVAETDVPESVTLSDGQHHRIVRQSHLGIDAAIERVGQDQGRTAEVAVAEFF